VTAILSSFFEPSALSFGFVFVLYRVQNMLLKKSDLNFGIPSKFCIIDNTSFKSAESAITDVSSILFDV